MDYMERAEYAWSQDSVRLIATPSAAAKASFFYVQEAGYFKTQPEYFTERSHLNSYLTVFTLSGKGYLKYRDKSYTLLPGQAFFIDCMEHHFYETDKEDLWEMLWVHFNGATSRGYFEQYIRNKVPIITVTEDSPIKNILVNIVEAHKRKDARTEILSSKFLSELLTELLLVNNNIDASSNFLPDYIKAVANELDRRFNEKITLDQLADKFSISKFHLSREFKKFIGITPNEYLINNRINYSKELLKYSSKPITEIAETVGIDNISHFINLFKYRTGATPLSFRNKWKNI
jgi:AraC-like DNA-binding protein